MGPGRHGSRGGAAIIVLALHIGALVFLINTLGRVIIPESPTVAPMLVRLIDLPRAQHPEAEPPLLRPRFITLPVRPADTPPDVRIDIPVEVAPTPAPTEISATLLPASMDGEDAGLTTLHQVAPTYSEASVRAHEQGTVTLRVMVDAQGAPSQIRLSGSSGFPRLDQSATEAVRLYRFSPPAREAQGRQTWKTVKVEFDLLRMPVPTSIVAFDTAVAGQIAAARQSKPGIRLDILNITPRVTHLADYLLQSLAPDHESDPARSHASPTPIQQLARQGRMRSVRFLGFASRGFDCGTATPPLDPRDARCEIFEVQQTRGSSYWLALVGESGTHFENFAIALADRLSAVNVPR